MDALLLNPARKTFHHKCKLASAVQSKHGVMRVYRNGAEPSAQSQVAGSHSHDDEATEANTGGCTDDVPKYTNIRILMSFLLGSW